MSNQKKYYEYEVTKIKDQSIDDNGDIVFFGPVDGLLGAQVLSCPTLVKDSLEKQKGVERGDGNRGHSDARLLQPALTRGLRSKSRSPQERSLRQDPPAKNTSKISRARSPGL